MKIFFKPATLFKIVSSAVLILVIQFSYAASVVPGATINLSGTTYNDNNDLGGSSEKSTLVPFEIKDGSGTVVLKGNYMDDVTLSTNTGKLIFAPRLTGLSSPNGASWVTALQVTGYTGVATDIEYRTDGSGDVGANSVTRSATAGDELLFTYNPNVITPPQNGYFINILTDVMSYCLNGSITISAQATVGGLVYSTTLSDRASPDTSGSGSSCTTVDPTDHQSTTPTIDSNLKIHVPSATYDSGQGSSSNLWFTLEYNGTDGTGAHTWKLKEYGVN